MASPAKKCEEKEERNPSMEDIDNSKQFLQRCEALYKTGDFSDIKLRVGDTNYAVHKFILVTASNVFRAMLTGRMWMEADKSEISLQEDEECVEVFGIFLRYLYCGHISLTTDNVLPILLLANKYEVLPLCESCISYMLRHVVESPDSNRTLTWYQYAKMTGENELAKECHKFILSNFDIIPKTSDWLDLTLQEMVEFLKCSNMVTLSEMFLWMELQRWLLCEKNKPDLERNLAEVMPLIRFTKISPQDLAEIESSEICVQHKSLFVNKFHEAYKHHSLSINAPSMPVTESFRNYTHPTYQLSTTFTCANFTAVPKGDSRVHLTMEIPAQYYPMNHQRRPDQFANFEVYIFPKGVLPSFRLYGSYRESPDVKLRVSRRGNQDLPVLVEVTLILQGKKNALVYTAFTHQAQHIFCKESPELQLDKIVDVAKLEEKDSPFLISGSLHGRIFLRLQDIGEHLTQPPA